MINKLNIVIISILLFTSCSKDMEKVILPFKFSFYNQGDDSLFSVKTSCDIRLPNENLTYQVSIYERTLYGSENFKINDSIIFINSPGDSIKPDFYEGCSYNISVHLSVVKPDRRYSLVYNKVDTMWTKDDASIKIIWPNDSVKFVNWLY